MKHISWTIKEKEKKSKSNKEGGWSTKCNQKKIDKKKKEKKDKSIYTQRNTTKYCQTRSYSPLVPLLKSQSHWIPETINFEWVTSGRNKPLLLKWNTLPTRPKSILITGRRLAEENSSRKEAIQIRADVPKNHRITACPQNACCNTFQPPYHY